jgi:drug/metabolite transporter superfamily protein YnfA
LLVIFLFLHTALVGADGMFLAPCWCWRRLFDHRTSLAPAAIAAFFLALFPVLITRCAFGEFRRRFIECGVLRFSACTA